MCAQMRIEMQTPFQRVIELQLRFANKSGKDKQNSSGECSEHCAIANARPPEAHCDCPTSSQTQAQSGPMRNSKRLHTEPNRTEAGLSLENPFKGTIPVSKGIPHSNDQTFSTETPARQDLGHLRKTLSCPKRVLFQSCH